MYIGFLSGPEFMDFIEIDIAHSHHVHLPVEFFIVDGLKLILIVLFDEFIELFEGDWIFYLNAS